MNYYYLIAGLPDISIDDHRVSMSPTEVIEELLERVEPADRRLLELYLRRHDNANLLTLLQGRKGAAWDEAGLLTREALTEAVEAIRLLGRDAEVTLPDYMTQFLVGYFRPETLTEDPNAEVRDLFALSRLSERYYAEAARCRNRVIAAWFDYERRLGDLLTTFTCRRLGLNAAPYLIGGESDEDFEERDEVAQIAAGTDAVDKERRLDALRWRHVEELTQLCHFGIERLFTFLVQTDIIRRWQRLDEAAGEAKLRAMIEALKQGALAQAQ